MKAVKIIKSEPCESFLILMPFLQINLLSYSVVKKYLLVLLQIPLFCQLPCIIFFSEKSVLHFAFIRPFSCDVPLLLHNVTLAFDMQHVCISMCILTVLCIKTVK